MEPTDKTQLSTKYLIYIDILGFESLAEEIAAKSLLNDRQIREEFVHTIDEKIDECILKGEVLGKATGRDDWVIAVESLDLVFKTIAYISNHNSGFRGYENIPLEIAVGKGQYDRWAKFENKKLIYEKSTIVFLKNDILDVYKRLYKRAHSSIRTTFVLFTEEAYIGMPYFDKQLLSQIKPDCEDKAIVKTFYEADFSRLASRGKLYYFLDKIGKSKNSAFRRIDCAFVPSNEHGIILEALESSKVVFLIGDPEIGKTFTAARFLWEYSQKGFNPIWNAGGEDLQRESMRQKLCEANVENRSITYFEDPFGRRKFEDREELRRIISAIIKQIQMLDSRVIISSRERVFREFEAGILSQHDFSHLIVEMNLMTPSYTNEKKTEMLSNWAKEMKCKWMEDESSNVLVLSEATGTLSTPLSLWDFAVSSQNCIGYDEIDKLIQDKSKAIKASFAEEIAQMPKQHIVYLSLSSIFTNLDYSLLKRTYYRICADLEIDQKLPFEHLEELFSKKVAFEVREGTNRKFCHFTHPSYEEGVIGSWNRVEVQPLILGILNILVHNNEPAVRGFVGLSLIKSYDDINFNNKARELINIIIKDKKALTRFGLAEGLEGSFRKIPLAIALQYIDVLIKDRNREVRNQIIRVVSYNIDAIPDEKVYEVMSLGLEDRAAIVRFDTIQHIRNYYGMFPISLVKKALQVDKDLCNNNAWLVSTMADAIYDDLCKKVKELEESEENYDES